MGLQLVTLVGVWTIVGMLEDPDILQKEFTEWFRALLAEHGLTKMEAAVALGMRSPRSVEVWTRGHALPSYPHLVAIVRAFGVLPPALEPPEPEEPPTGAAEGW